MILLKCYSQFFLHHSPFLLRSTFHSQVLLTTMFLLSLSPSEIQIAVIWKRTSSNAFVDSFSDLLVSKQAAINAEYVR